MTTVTRKNKSNINISKIFWKDTSQNRDRGKISKDNTDASRKKVYMNNPDIIRYMTVINR